MTSLTQPLIIYWQGVRELSLVSVVRFEHVKTLFDSTQSQESKSEIGAAMRTRTHFKTHFVSLVSGVRCRCMRPFFASTESQESKSDMNIARQCALRYI